MDANDSNIIEAKSRCIDSCQRCHRACLDLADNLLEAQPGTNHSKLFTSLVTCIGTTRIAAELLLMDSRSHNEACQLCAVACLAAAALCKCQDGAEDCMKACSECAECCEAAMERQVA